MVFLLPLNHNQTCFFPLLYFVSLQRSYNRHTEPMQIYYYEIVSQVSKRYINEWMYNNNSGTNVISIVIKIATIPYNEARKMITFSVKYLNKLLRYKF